MMEIYTMKAEVDLSSHGINDLGDLWYDEKDEQIEIGTTPWKSDAGRNTITIILHQSLAQELAEHILKILKVGNQEYIKWRKCNG